MWPVAGREWVNFGFSRGNFGLFGGFGANRSQFEDFRADGPCLGQTRSGPIRCFHDDSEYSRAKRYRATLGPFEVAGIGLDRVHPVADSGTRGKGRLRAGFRGGTYAIGS